MKSEVEQMIEAEICSCDFQEWVGYLAGKYAVVPITLFETNIERTLLKQKSNRPVRSVIVLVKETFLR